MKTTQLLTLAVTALGLATGAVAQGNNGRNKGGQGGKATTTAAATTTTTTTAAAAASTTAAASGGNGGSGKSNNAGGANPLLLLQSNVQEGSNFAGNPAAGQASSNTDPANFINFCTGKTLTNGSQVTAGSCNGVVMGDIPSNANMVSAVVLFPGPGQDLAPNTAIIFKAQIQNLNAGVFTDPLTTYYASPQFLKNGNIVGHCHFTVQDLGGTLAPTSPPDPKTFAFFKGIDDAGNGQGLLQANLTAGLPAGFYRICTMNSAANHQPVLMPVAQRGMQDDCQKFTVGQGSGNAGGAAGGASGNNAAASSSTTTTTTTAAAATSSAASGGNKGNAGGNGGSNASSGSAATTTDAASASTTTAAAAASSSDSTGSGRGGNGGGKNGGGRGRYWRGRGRFAARDLIA